MRKLALFFLVGCGGSAFSAADPVLDAASELAGDVGAGIVDGGEAGSHDAGNDVDDELATDVAADVVDEHQELDVWTADVATADVAGEHQELDTWTADEPPDCPAGGCLCESGGFSCPPNLPYACSNGECCNWRAPGC